jgi:hypothetical protein
VFARPCRITSALAHACSRYLGLLLPRPSHSRTRANRASSALRARPAQHLSIPPTSVHHRVHARPSRCRSASRAPLLLRPSRSSFAQCTSAAPLCRPGPRPNACTTSHPRCVARHPLAPLHPRGVHPLLPRTCAPHPSQRVRAPLACSLCRAAP